ncbi:MAG: hypothetical protein U0X74_16445 [Anaerolineales bacterium]
MRGTGSLSAQSEQIKVVPHLGQAIDAQSKGNDTLAAEEMEAALNAGFSSSALSFSIGYLRFKNERYESSQRALQNSVKHEDFGLASRLLWRYYFTKRRLPRCSD